MRKLCFKIMWKLLNTKNFKYVMLAIPVAIIGIFYNKIFTKNNILISSDDYLTESYFYEEDLAKFDGITEKGLYLAVIGTVYDVTEGRKHYGKGSPYNYFIGKDGTRALVTGNFKDESNEKDHVLDLSCDEIMNVLNWRRTFKEKYIYKGLLVGRYYDKYGAETSYMIELKEKVKQCRIEKNEAKKQDHMYPPCNMAWSEAEGTRLWCTKSSGGIERNWEGVPRQLFTPGQEKPRCICVNLKQYTTSSMIKEYPGCQSSSRECILIN